MYRNVYRRPPDVTQAQKEPIKPALIPAVVAVVRSWLALLGVGS
jgi:hypothetical protein